MSSCVVPFDMLASRNCLLLMLLPVIFEDCPCRLAEVELGAEAEEIVDSSFEVEVNELEELVDVASHATMQLFNLPSASSALPESCLTSVLMV